MVNRSIYARPNAAVTGGSEQAHHEHLWAAGQRRRLIVRGVIAVAALVAGAVLFNPIVGVVLAFLAAGADLLYNWRRHASTAAWRAGDEGRGHTDRLLRLLLEWRGFTVLRNRRPPGAETDGEPAEDDPPDRVEHLVIGPTGVFLVHSLAWSPETQIGSYGGKLFFGKRSGEKKTAPVAAAARAVSAALSAALGEEIPVTAVVALHGGRLAGRTAIHSHGVTLLRAHRVPGWIRGHEVRRTAARGGVRTGPAETGDAAERAEPYTPEQVEGLARTAARVLRPRPLLPRG